MTRNVYVDGGPKPGELWCAPGRSPQGRFGIVVAVGHVKVTFIDEMDIEEYLLRLIATGGEQPTDGPSINGIRQAQRDLPKFKADYKASGAANN